MTDSSRTASIWKEQFKVHSYQADFRKAATLESLCQRFQEAAWNHAEELGLGYQRLQTENRIWVLSRMLIQINREPSWGEELTIQTWPLPVESVFATRDFELHDFRGNLILSGASAWLVLDQSTRKPQRVDKLVASIKYLSDRRALDLPFEKLAECASESNTGTEFIAHYSDIDANGHVNNSRYVGWIMDSYSMEYHRTHSVRRLAVNFLGETVWNDAVSVSSQKVNPLEFRHSIAKKGGPEVCRAQVQWLEKG